MSDTTSPEFRRYREASTAHHALQAERGELGTAADLAADDLPGLNDVEIALELAGVELDASRGAYLGEVHITNHGDELSSDSV